MAGPEPLVSWANPQRREDRDGLGPAEDRGSPERPGDRDDTERTEDRASPERPEDRDSPERPGNDADLERPDGDVSPERMENDQVAEVPDEGGSPERPKTSADHVDEGEMELKRCEQGQQGHQTRSTQMVSEKTISPKRAKHSALGEPDRSPALPTEPHQSPPKQPRESVLVACSQSAPERRTPRVPEPPSPVEQPPRSPTAPSTFGSWKARHAARSRPSAQQARDIGEAVGLCVESALEKLLSDSGGLAGRTDRATQVPQCGPSAAAPGPAEARFQSRSRRATAAHEAGKENRHGKVKREVTSGRKHVVPGPGAGEARKTKEVRDRVVESEDQKKSKTAGKSTRSAGSEGVLKRHGLPSSRVIIRHEMKTGSPHFQTEMVFNEARNSRKHGQKTNAGGTPPDLTRHIHKTTTGGERPTANRAPPSGDPHTTNRGTSSGGMPTTGRPASGGNPQTTSRLPSRGEPSANSRLTSSGGPHIAGRTTSSGVTHVTSHLTSGGGPTITSRVTSGGGVHKSSRDPSSSKHRLSTSERTSNRLLSSAEAVTDWEFRTGRTTKGVQSHKLIVQHHPAGSMSTNVIRSAATTTMVAQRLV
ncbi:neurofilament medium polypeptide-like [Pollicipes pollicipes]|uniref:neurofilament medium polypeptide-like n=1 Tax=Pollicipes pollicipes TaxID=41117 RepID=UPI0018852E24|nr:neurofilament medium polypeptide-like [Pollicipes pollicipes]